MDANKLPLQIQSIIGAQIGYFDKIGLSDSSVIIYDDAVLKIEKHRSCVDATVDVMSWLSGKIPVPQILCYEVENGYSYTLMSKVIGKMSCDEYYLDNPDLLVQLLIDGMKMLWSVDISGCPRIRDLDAELEEAKYRVENKLVDINDAEPTTFGEGGFDSPSHLLDWLIQNKPEYEPVLSHGDYCLPNILVNQGKISGFIDLGDCGVGDKWRDISLCYRSLKNNFNGTYGGKVYENFDPDLLFKKLGIEPNHEKLRYYLLLDELF